MAHLFGGLFLQVKRGTNNGYSVRTEVTAELTDGGVHCDEFFEFATTIDNTVMGTETQFKNFCDWPSDDTLRETFR